MTKAFYNLMLSPGWGTTINLQKQNSTQTHTHTPHHARKTTTGIALYACSLARRPARAGDKRFILPSHPSTHANSGRNPPSTRKKKKKEVSVAPGGTGERILHARLPPARRTVRSPPALGRSSPPTGEAANSISEDVFLSSRDNKSIKTFTPSPK